MAEAARSGPSPGADIFQVGRYRVNLSAREVYCGEQRIPLPWRSFEALQVLIEARGEIVERDTFFGRLWPGVVVGESSLNQCITKLRRDLGEPAEGGLIATVPRRGYRLTQVPESIQLPAADAVPLLAVPERPRRWRAAIWILAVAAALGLAGSYGWRRWEGRVQALALTEEGFRHVRENPVSQLAVADSLFRRAIDIDPGLAPAYAGLAEVIARTVDSSPEQAESMAARAVQLDPRCAQCKAVDGWIMLGRQWRFREAAQNLEQAAALNPRDPRILLWHAQMLACSGHLGPALTEIDRARALDFKEPAVLAMRAGILYLSGRYREAIAAARETLGLKPNDSSSYYWIYRSDIQLHRVEEALAARAAMNAVFLGLTPDSRFEMEGKWTTLYLQSGLPKLVEYLLAQSASKPGLDQQRYERATWRMWVGDRQGALEELEHVFDFHPFNSIYVGVDPSFASLHGEGRFRELLSRMGLAAMIAR